MNIGLILHVTDMIRTNLSRLNVQNIFFYFGLTIRNGSNWISMQGGRVSYELVSEKFLELILKITVYRKVAIQQGIDWETLANMVTVLSFLGAVVIVWHRCRYATPLDKLLLEGSDRILMQIGAEVSIIARTLMLMVMMNTMPFVIAPLFAGMNPELQSSLVNYLLLYSVFLTTILLFTKGKDTQYGVTRFIIGFQRMDKGLKLIYGYILTCILGLTELVCLWVFLGRLKNNSSIVFVILMLVVNIFFTWYCLVFSGKSDNEAKTKIERASKLTREFGIIACSADVIYGVYFAKVPWDFRVRMCFLMLLIGTLITIETQENDTNKSIFNPVICAAKKLISCFFTPGWNTEIYHKIREKVNRIYTDVIDIAGVLIVGVVWVPVLLRGQGIHALKDLYNSGDLWKNTTEFFLQFIKPSPYANIIFFVEFLVLYVMIGLNDVIKKVRELQNNPMRVVDISSGISYYAYRVYEGQLLCGENSNIENEKTPNFIEMSKIYKREWVLTSAESVPQRVPCELDNARGKVEIEIDVIIDVSDKETSNRCENHIESMIIYPKIADKGAMDYQSEPKINSMRKDTRVLVCCGDSERLQIAAWRLIVLGYENVFMCHTTGDWSWTWKSRDKKLRGEKA